MCGQMNNDHTNTIYCHIVSNDAHSPITQIIMGPWWIWPYVHSISNTPIDFLDFHNITINITGLKLNLFTPFHLLTVSHPSLSFLLWEELIRREHSDSV